MGYRIEVQLCDSGDSTEYECSLCKQKFSLAEKYGKLSNNGSFVGLVCHDCLKADTPDLMAERLEEGISRIKMEVWGLEDVMNYLRFLQSKATEDLAESIGG